MEADSVGRLELVFVGLGILAWMSILKKDAESAESVLMSFRERAQKENPNLLPNIDAFLCRVHLYEGKDISDWLEKAPDEHKEFCMMDRFQYLTKVRVYLQMEKYGAAYGLLQQILFYAEKMNRNYISMEAKTSTGNCAISHGTGSMERNIADLHQSSGNLFILYGFSAGKGQSSIR